jgi:hypothetical protein
MAKKDILYSDKYGDYLNAKLVVEEGSTPLDDLAEQFGEFLETANRYAKIFDLEAEFMESLGYVSRGRDNTYNTDNDLDANIVWQVWDLKTADFRRRGDDWIYAVDDVDDETGLPLRVTTCAFNYGDPRGSYSDLRFVTGEFSGGEYSAPVDVSVSYYFEPIDPNDDDAVEVAQSLNNEGRFGAGYSGSPVSLLEREADSFDRNDEGEITVEIEGVMLRALPDYFV